MSSFMETLPSFETTRSSSGMGYFGNVHGVQRRSSGKDDAGARSTGPLGDCLSGPKDAAVQPPLSMTHNLATPFKDVSITNHGTPRTDVSYNMSVQSLPPGMEIRTEDEVGFRGQIERLQKELLHARTTIADCKDDLSTLKGRLQASETHRRTVVLELEETSQQLRACKRSMEEQRREHAKEKLDFIELKSQRDDLLEKMQEAWDRVAALVLEQKKSEAEKVLLQEAVWHEFGLSEQQAAALHQHLQSLNSRALELTHEKQETNDNYVRLLHCTGDAVRELSSTLKSLINETFEHIRSLQAIDTSLCIEGKEGRDLLGQTGAELEKSWVESFDRILQSNGTQTEGTANAVASTREIVQQLLTPLLRSLQGIGSVWRHLCHERQKALAELKDAHKAQSTLFSDIELLQQTYTQPSGRSVRQHEENTVVDVGSVHGLSGLAHWLGCDATWEAVQSCVVQLQQRCQDTPVSTEVSDQDNCRAASIARGSGKAQLNENTSRFDTLLKGSSGSPKKTSSVQSRQHAHREPSLQIKPTSIPEMKPCYQTVPPAHLPPRGLRQTGLLTPSRTFQDMVSTPRRGQTELKSGTEMLIGELEKRVGVRNDMLFFFAAACCGLISDLATVIQQRKLLYRYLQWITYTDNTFAHLSSARLSTRRRRKCLRIWVLAVLAAHRLRNAVLNQRDKDSRFLKRRWWRDRLRRTLASGNGLLHSRCTAGAMGGRSGADVWSDSLCRMLDSEGNGELISVMGALLEVAETVDVLHPGGYLEHGSLPSLTLRMTPPHRSSNHTLEPGANHRSLFDRDEKPRPPTYDPGSEVTTPPLSLAGGSVKRAPLNEQHLVGYRDSYEVTPERGLNLTRSLYPACALSAEVDISLLSSIRNDKKGDNERVAANSEPNRPNGSLLGLTVGATYPVPVLKPSHASATSEQAKGFAGGPGLEGKSVEDALKLSIQQDYLERAHRGAMPHAHFSPLHQDSAEDSVIITDNYSSKVHVSFPSETFATEVMGMIEALDRCVTGALKRGEAGV